jgi:hypothetical protein
MLPLKLLWVRSSTANDNELMQNGEGTNPWKLLLLALSTTRLLLVFSHTAYGNSPVNKLLEMFNTCSGMLLVTEELFSCGCRTLLSWLKLTSSTTMLLEARSSDGRLPVKELYDRLRLWRLLRSPRDDEMH